VFVYTYYLNCLATHKRHLLTTPSSANVVFFSFYQISASRAMGIFRWYGQQLRNFHSRLKRYKKYKNQLAIQI